MSAGSSSLSWCAARGVPENVLLGALKIEVREDQAVVAIEPDGQDGTAAGAGGPEAGGGHLDLLVGRALDGDLAGGLAPDRGHDHQPVRPQQECAGGRPFWVAGRA